jgi:hypothetical protein
LIGWRIYVIHILAADHLVLVVLLRELAEAGRDPHGVAAPAAAAEAQLQVQRRLLLDAVVGQGAAVVVQLLAREDEALLLRRDAFLALDHGLHVLDGVVAALHLQRDRLPRQRLHEHLHHLAHVVLDAPLSLTLCASYGFVGWVWYGGTCAPSPLYMDTRR